MTIPTTGAQSPEHPSFAGANPATLDKALSDFIASLACLDASVLASSVVAEHLRRALKSQGMLMGRERGS